MLIPMDPKRTPTLPAQGSVEMGLIALQAATIPGSFDANAQTVKVRFLKVGAKVLRVPWFDKPFELSFDLSPGSIRMERLKSGSMPTLLDHNRNMGSLAGVVTEGDVSQKDGGTATIQLSQRDDLEGFRRDVEAGVAANISMGVSLHTLRDTTEKTDTIRQLLAIDWEPVELSFVTVQAMEGTRTLSYDGDQATSQPEGNLVTCSIQGATKTQVPIMADTPKAGDGKTPTQLAPSTTIPASQVAPPAAAAALAAPAAPVAPVAPAVAPTAAQLQETARLEERQRGVDIREACRLAAVPLDLGEELINSGATLSDARGAIINRRAELDAVPTSAPTDARLSVGQEEGTKIMLGMQNALEVRAGVMDNRLDSNGQILRGPDGRAITNLASYDELGHNFRGHTMLEMARLCLETAGISTTGMGKMDLAQAALGMAKVRWQPRFAERKGFQTALAQHSTSDFPLLLANTASKTLRQAYTEAAQTFRAWARRGTLPDFKPMTRVQLGEAANLLLVPEGAEVTRGTVGETGETIVLASYKRKFSITREAMINDDLSAFTRMPQSFGMAASRLESDLVYQQVTDNPTLSDGFAVFDDTNHGNAAAGLTTFDVAALSALRQRARRQKALDRSTGATSFLGLSLVHMVVPEDLETVAQQLTTALQAQQVSNVNPFVGTFVSVAAEARLGADSQSQFYMFTAPGEMDGLEYAFLQGEEGPVMETRQGFDIDGMDLKVREDFGVSWTDFRGAYRGAL